LEVGWLPPLVNSARNDRILSDAPGHIVLARFVPLIEVPSGPVDRSMGDVHPLGNPHFWSDPVNGKIIAKVLAERFSHLFPQDAEVFQVNLGKFTTELEKRMVEWSKVMEPYRGTKVVTYHKSYDYFLQRFGLVLAGTIEPKPGVEPSPTYINNLVTRIKAEGVKLVIVEPFRPRKTPEYLARAIGAKLLILPEKVGGNANAKDYFSLFDYDVNQIAKALKESN
jgi:ABC-type Zn uptake system ZnuABC Zn-binding protein ZnuA